MECAYCGEYNEEMVKTLVEKSVLVMVHSGLLYYDQPTISYANVDQMGIDVLLFNTMRKVWILISPNSSTP